LNSLLIKNIREEVQIPSVSVRNPEVSNHIWKRRVGNGKEKMVMKRVPNGTPRRRPN